MTVNGTRGRVSRCRCGRVVRDADMRWYRVTTLGDMRRFGAYVPTRDTTRRGHGTTANVEYVRTGKRESTTVDVHVCADCAWRITRPGAFDNVREISATDATDRATRPDRVTPGANDRPPIVATNGRRVVVF